MRAGRSRRGPELIALVTLVAITPACGTIPTLEAPVESSQVLSIPRADAWRLLKRVIPWSIELESERAALIVYTTHYGRDTVKVNVLLDAEGPTSTRVYVRPTYFSVVGANAPGAAERAVFEALHKALAEQRAPIAR